MYKLWVPRVRFLKIFPWLITVGKCEISTFSELFFYTLKMYISFISTVYESMWKYEKKIRNYLYFFKVCLNWIFISPLWISPHFMQYIKSFFLFTFFKLLWIEFLYLQHGYLIILCNKFFFTIFFMLLWIEFLYLHYGYLIILY